MMQKLYARQRANASGAVPPIMPSGSIPPVTAAVTCGDEVVRSTCRSEAALSSYAVRSTEDDESAGGYFVTGTMKDLVPTW